MADTEKMDNSSPAIQPVDLQVVVEDRIVVVDAVVVRLFTRGEMAALVSQEIVDKCIERARLDKEIARLEKSRSELLKRPNDPLIDYPEPTGRQGGYSKEDWRKLFGQFDSVGMKPPHAEIARHMNCSVDYVGRKWREYQDTKVDGR